MCIRDSLKVEGDVNFYRGVVGVQDADGFVTYEDAVAFGMPEAVRYVPFHVLIPPMIAGLFWIVRLFLLIIV